MRGAKRTAVRTARKRKAPAARRRAKSKPCPHTHANYDTLWRDERLTVRGCYAIVRDEPNFGYGEYRQIFGVRCVDCGATLPLGPSNDDSPAVPIEMRAAEIGGCGFMGKLRSDDEKTGWSDHWLSHDLDDEDPAGWLASWLGREIAIGGDDSTAWAWRTDRPLAEQLAETTEWDAAADRIVAMDRRDATAALEYELTRDAEPDCRDEDGPEVERIMENIDE
jgi:hypothetical protein